MHKIGAIIGLGFAYAGSARTVYIYFIIKKDLSDLLVPIVLDGNNTLELSAIAALNLGLIFVGTCDEDAAQAILQTLIERDEAQLERPFARYFALALGLVFLGRQDLVEATLQTVGVVSSEKYAKFLSIVVESCAYAGTGNVLKVQQLLHICAEHKEGKDAFHQVFN